MAANVVLCPDTRKLSPVEARNVWWEASLYRTPTNRKGLLQGFGPYCFVVSARAHGAKSELPRFAVGPLRVSSDDEQSAVFKTAQEADRFAGEMFRSLPRTLPVLYGPSAMAERQRVWRVDGK